MKKTTIVTATFLLIALLFSCRGSQQNKLIGNWERIPYTKPSEVRFYYWQIFAGDALQAYSLDSTGLKIDSVDYTYSIERKKFSIFGEGEYYPAQGDIRGDYRVEQLNDEFFKITKTQHPSDTSGNNWADTLGTIPSPFLRIELVKR